MNSEQCACALIVNKKSPLGIERGFFKLFRHDASFRRPEELKNRLYLRTVGHLLLDLVDHIEDARLSVEEQTIGIGDVLLNLLVDAGIVHHGGVGTAVLDGFAACHNERGNILRERGAGLYHRQTAYAGVGILDDGAGEDGAIVDLTIARNLHTIAKHAVVANDGVVTDVGTLQKEVAVANLGHTSLVGTTVDDDILADDIVVANLHIRLGATEIEVLWQSSDDGALVDLVVLTDARAVADRDEGEDDTVVAYLYIVLDIDEGEYLTVVADFRLWAYLSFGTNFTCHTLFFSFETNDPN